MYIYVSSLDSNARVSFHVKIRSLNPPQRPSRCENVSSINFFFQILNFAFRSSCAFLSRMHCRADTRFDDHPVDQTRRLARCVWQCVHERRGSTFFSSSCAGRIADAVCARARKDECPTTSSRSSASSSELIVSIFFFIYLYIFDSFVYK